MTARDAQTPATPEFDRMIAAWFDTEARVQEPPDLIERILVRRRRTRPRPGWLLPERWLPLKLTMRRARVPRVATYLALLIVLALVALVAVAIVGSQRKIPAPFGLAANGALIYATPTGDIATVDPATGVTTTIIGGEASDRAPSFSRDGLRIAFVRRVTGGDAVFVADASGERPVRLTPDPMAEVPGLTWSADGTKLAFVSLERVWIAKTDGSGADPIDTGDIGSIVELAWLPPDGRELLIAGHQEGKLRLFTVGLDGSALRQVTPLDDDEGAFQWVSPSPDGHRIAYGTFPALKIHIVTIDNAKDEVVVPDGGAGLNFPRWSPDGTRIAVLQVADDGATQIGVIPADDLSPRVILTGPAFTGGVQFEWSPDGRSIFANQWGSDVTWLLDPSGGAGTQNSWRANFPDFVEWQRRAD